MDADQRSMLMGRGNNLRGNISIMQQRDADIETSDNEIIEEFNSDKRKRHKD